MRNLKAPEKKLFAYLFKKFKVKTDAELAEKLYASGASISRMRNNHKYLTAKLILIIYDKTGLSIEKIRQMAVENVDEKTISSGRRTGNGKKMV
jgi:plasmid maintenance system antidote protein VapI